MKKEKEVKGKLFINFLPSINVKGGIEVFHSVKKSNVSNIVAKKNYQKKISNRTLVYRNKNQQANENS